MALDAPGGRRPHSGPLPPRPGARRTVTSGQPSTRGQPAPGPANLPSGTSPAESSSTCSAPGSSPKATPLGCTAGRSGSAVTGDAILLRLIGWRSAWWCCAVGWLVLGASGLGSVIQRSTVTGSAPASRVARSGVSLRTHTAIMALICSVRPLHLPARVCRRSWHRLRVRPVRRRGPRPVGPATTGGPGYRRMPRDATPGRATR